MTTKNKLITASILSCSSFSAISLINKLIKISAASKNLLNKSEKLCYHWRFGDIYYTKEGSGRPLLLIHDLDAAASSYEWHKITSILSRKYTVYAVDLLGCGESEKPCLTYTNYLYVQLISDFIKSEIGHRTDVIASGASASFVIMACSNSPDLFDRLMLVNPDSINVCNQFPGHGSKYFKLFLDFPVIGTLIYHIAYSKSSLRESFASRYYADPKLVKESYIDTYYESAHLGFSPKSVYACVRCNYIRCGISKALKKIDNSIYIIGGKEEDCIQNIILEYVNCNPAIEYSVISHARHLPHMEKPAEFLINVNTFFSFT